MGALTGVLYGLLAVFLGGWYFGKWSGNFSLLLLILTVVTFGYWLAERFVFAPRRRAAAATLEQQDQARRAKLSEQGITKVDSNLEQARESLLAQPWWLDWTAGLFPVILVVFLLRSFLFEPFKIPSGSMIPTLLIGDLILVNKYHYGVRLPVINKKIIANNDPQRGDVMVFRYPKDTSIDYIKRVVGVPGDEISFRNQQLYVNGVAAPMEQTPPPGFYDEDLRQYFPEFKEKLGAVEHEILLNPRSQPFYGPEDKITFPYRENCRYSAEGVTCKVPPGNYFMMGDNRDNSQDSRFWGFVPDENIVGKAFFVWMNFGNLKRIGGFH
ncbi:signal peptidase I [Rhizobacter sp. Root404]|uniref:signal peptidase I n=1 Tax=Rhizobacter sp. Root404 TaxID=1736528 RepID=UPI0006F4F227|nr:signal peptidase I [Rhizobacter sp. Root404]KQW38217.1 S26 family signal peptidase [Rhizobacter sp. Root404]